MPIKKVYRSVVVKLNDWEPADNKRATVLGQTVAYCTGCAHQHERIDRDRCSSYQDCRRPRREPVSCWHGSEFDGDFCEFPDCTEPAKKHFRTYDYCWRHYEVVYRRVHGGWPETKLHDPVSAAMARKLGQPIEGRDYLFCCVCGKKKNRPRGVTIATFEQRKYCSRECANKDKWASGSTGNSKITEKEVREIRSLYPELSYKKIAKKYKVTPESVRLIVKRVTWRNVKQ